MVNSPFCASQGRAVRAQTLLFALPLRGQQAVIPAGTADPTYVQARGTRPHPIFFPDQLQATIPFSCAVVDRRFMKHLCQQPEHTGTGSAAPRSAAASSRFVRRLPVSSAAHYTDAADPPFVTRL